jgi:hypothetical protein
MTFLLLCLLVAPPSFAAGWFGHDYWMTSELRARVAEGASMNWSKHAVTILFGLLVFGVLGNIIYTNTTVDASEERRLEDTRQDLACISRTFEEFLSGNQVLRDASAKRDDALVASKRALRELIRLRVVDQVQDSEAVQQAADQYLVQTQRFIDASKELNEARKDYQLPDFEKACGNIPAK